MNVQPNTEPTPQQQGGLWPLLRMLYAPYVWLIFAPFLALTTIAWGILAVGLCLFSPRLAFHCGTIWAWILCRMNFTWVRIRGRKNAVPVRSYIIMSNHQSHFDVLAFYGHWGRQFRWVIKEELRHIPGLGWYCAAGGHVFIDRSSRQKAIDSLRAAGDLLQGGISVMFFPEGTRSPDGRLQSFKKRGFMMALDLGLPILPVSISGSYGVLPGKSYLPLPGLIKIQVHQPIDPTRYDVSQRDELMRDVRRAISSGLTDWEKGSGHA